jgi:hypothetical protein
MVKAETFPGALKRSFPRINAGASTKKYTPWDLCREKGGIPIKLW